MSSFSFYGTHLFYITQKHICWTCDQSLPALNHLDYEREERTPLRDRDLLEENPEWLPGFLSRCSWMFPEQLRNKSELVGSEKIDEA